MTENDYKEFLEFKKFKAQQERPQQPQQPQMSVIQPMQQPPQQSRQIVIQEKYLWAAGIGGLILLIAAWPFTLLGFFIGLFARFHFFGDKPN